MSKMSRLICRISICRIWRKNFRRIVCSFRRKLAIWQARIIAWKVNLQMLVGSLEKKKINLIDKLVVFRRKFSSRIQDFKRRKVKILNKRSKFNYFSKKINWNKLKLKNYNTKIKTCYKNNIKFLPNKCQKMNSFNSKIYNYKQRLCSCKRNIKKPSKKEWNFNNKFKAKKLK